MTRNFGVPGSPAGTALVRVGAEITIEEVCRLNNIGHMRTVDFVLAAEALFGEVREGGSRRRSSLLFLANILRTLEGERRISASSLLYLEEAVSELASRILDQQLFMASMSVIVDIRAALFAMSGFDAAADYPGEATVSGVHIFFDGRFGPGHVEILRDTMEKVAGAESGTLKLTKLEHGSTLIEFITSQALSLVGLITAVNLIISQATVTVGKYANLKKALAQTRNPAPSGSQHPVPRARVPDILKSGVVAPKLAPLKTAVKKHGRALVEMDEPAQVAILHE